MCAPTVTIEKKCSFLGMLYLATWFFIVLYMVFAGTLSRQVGGLYGGNAIFPARCARLHMPALRHILLYFDYTMPCGRMERNLQESSGKCPYYTAKSPRHSGFGTVPGALHWFRLCSRTGYSSSTVLSLPTGSSAATSAVSGVASSSASSAALS